MKTAWFLTHRIREIMKPSTGAGPLGGEGKTIEADVTYVGRKPFTKRRQGGGSNMNPVFSLIERHGGARSVHMPNVRVENLGAALDNHASRQERTHDRRSGGVRATRLEFCSRTNPSTTARTNTCAAKATASSPPTRLKAFSRSSNAGIYGVYQHVSEAHLHRYLNEFDFRYSNREKLGVNDVARASRALAGAKGRRLTYETTLFDGR